MPAPQRPVDEHGFPLPAKFEAPAREPMWQAEKATRAGRWGRWKWALFLFLPAILFAPRIYDLACDYFAGWQLQRADHELAVGDFQRARRSIEGAIRWEPESYRHFGLYQVRAEVREKLQDLQGAKDDCNEALKLLAKSKRATAYPYPLAEIYRMRSWIEERLGNHQAALADAKTAISLCPADDLRPLPELLNSRAYICALSGLELESGLSDINRALADSDEDSSSELIDTRAYLLLKLGRANDAIKEIEKAIAPVEQARLRLERQIQNADLWQARSDDVRRMRYFATIVDHDLAVMYHHRSEILEKLGKKDAAREDADRATKYGYDPAKGVL
jgi:tetratricopeptide (TPR) repeat protein